MQTQLVHDGELLHIYVLVKKEVVGGGEFFDGNPDQGFILDLARPLSLARGQHHQLHWLSLPLQLVNGFKEFVERHISRQMVVGAATYVG